MSASKICGDTKKKYENKIKKSPKKIFLKIIKFCLISAMFGQKTANNFYIFDLILDMLV
jgi:hypothetical protein